MTITVQEAAARLNHSQYREEGPEELFAEMKAAGLVAVFGASDDLMEFRGAVYDEVGAWEGTIEYFTSAGLLQNDCDNDDCPHFARAKEQATKVLALWDTGGFSWRYETTIPHAKFIVYEDEEPYCEGIVFALADVPSAAGRDGGGAP